MKKAAIPSNEFERLNAIYEYEILDSFTEEDYDILTKIAAEICQTEISLISFVDKDRQWFKSKHGLSVSETPRDFSFCAHAINNPTEVFIINDARQDERFFDNPLVTADPHVIFYAGVPLLSESGFPMGTMCVIDSNPKQLSENQINALRGLSKQVINLMELRKGKLVLEDLNKTLKEKNERLETFAMVAAHDLKSPLKNIASLVDIVLEDHIESIDDEKQKMLALLKKSSNKLLNLVDGMLAYCKSDRILEEKKASVNFKEFFEQINELFIVGSDIKIEVKIEANDGFLNITALSQIFINLISNAIKYNDKANTEINILAQESAQNWIFTVADNGQGIDEEFHDKIFDLYQVLVSKDKYGNKGNGIGLNTVKNLVEKQAGGISLSSVLGEGTKFTFTLAK